MLCLSTTVTLMVYLLARREGLRAALMQTNARSVMALWLGGMAALSGLFALRPATTADDLIDGLLNFTSGLTTAGFSVSGLAEAPPLVAFLLAAMLIGGGAGSTAGGIKADRVATMLRMLSLTLTRMRLPPRAVTHLKADGGVIREERIISLVAVMACYAMTAFAVWILLLSSGVAPMAGLFDTVSALSTVGLSSGVTGPDLAPHLKLVLAAAMLLGRLEFLAVLVALSPATWIRRGGP